MIINNPFSLENKRIIVTGASSGIGRQCAISCAEMGAELVLIARNKEELCNTEKLLPDGIISHYLVYDFNDLDGIKALVKNIAETYGKIDGLICAAGIEKSLPFKVLKPIDYENVYKINFISSMELIKNVVLKSNRNSNLKIVLISSITSLIGRKTVTAYAASKGAMISAIKSVALEYAKDNININCVSPGTILTPMMKKVIEELPEDARLKRLNAFPLGLGEAVDVANTCVFLLSNAAKWITGTNVIVDGGYTAQ